MELKTSINSLSLGRSVGRRSRAVECNRNSFSLLARWKGNTRKIVFSRENFRFFIFIRHAAGNTLNSFCFILLFLHAQAEIARRHENIYRAREPPHTRARGERESAGSELFS